MKEKKEKKKKRIIKNMGFQKQICKEQEELIQNKEKKTIWIMALGKQIAREN